MNKLTSVFSELLCAILLIVACGTWFAYCVVDTLPGTYHDVSSFQFIVMDEVIAAAFFYLISRKFSKRHYDFVHSEDSGVSLGGEPVLEDE